LALLASLIGSYVNILLYTVKSGPVPHEVMVNNFGVIYAIPTEYAGASTTVAIDVGDGVGRTDRFDRRSRHFRQRVSHRNFGGANRWPLERPNQNLLH
jgi:hypothetical protein